MRPRWREAEPSRGLAEYLGIWRKLQNRLVQTHIWSAELGDLNALLRPVSRVDYPEPIMEPKDSTTCLSATPAMINLPASRRYLGVDSDDVKFHLATSRSPTVSRKNAFDGRGAGAGRAVVRASYHGIPSSSIFVLSVFEAAFTSSSARSRSRRRLSSFSFRFSSSSSLGDFEWLW